MQFCSAAMSSFQKQNFQIGRPQRTGWKFDLKRDTRVRVVSKVDGHLEGFVAVGCDQTSRYLELVRCVRYFGTGWNREEGVYVGYVRADGDDVISVHVIDPEVKAKPATAAPIEKLYRTIVISTDRELKRLVDLLEDVTEVGLNLYGIFVGRAGTACWIALFLENTLVCIDIQGFGEGNKDLWKILRDSLFSNEKICKVMYNVRPIQDYLYHRQSILLRNVEDLQVSEAETWFNKSTVELLKKKKVILKYKPLSEMLQVYLKDVVHPEEIQFLRDFEKEDFSLECPLTKTPVSKEERKYCKCVALDMKYLLKLQKVFREMLLAHHVFSTEIQKGELLHGRNDKMESQITDPLKIPGNVLRSFGKYGGSRSA